MKEVFPIASASASIGSWLVILMFLTVPILLVAYFLCSPRIVRFEVSPDGLRIRGDLFYSRMIAANDLILARARVIDLKEDKEHQLAWRRNGTALPNYKAGWFSLKDGEKALVFIGGSSRVAYIPVRSGYSVMLSAAEPERLIAALSQ
jgi:Bacterial PH domain